MDNLASKIISLEVMKTIREELRNQGKKVVLTNGCFDIMHIGHLSCLEAAKALGDILIVALNSDKSIKKLKGPKRPILPEKERAEILSAFKVVDYIVIFDELTVDKLLLELKPEFHAKGTDYTPETVPEKAAVESYGGKVVITGIPKERSTRNLISIIQEKFT